MRALLAVMTCHVGDLDRNLAAHLALIADARLAACDVAVFPELSLTGSLDPLRHPERAIPVEHPAVRTLAGAATGITVVFGIGERAGDEVFITQVAARDGVIVAAHRKRHLGDDEHGFAVGTGTPLLDIAGRRTGIIICAESSVAHTWDATAAAGAEVVLMCSAPGLYGRRTTEQEWRDGFEWWSSAGLADARRNAERLGLWVAMSTQAGSTTDEDFPGIAALVSPAGTVVERLPDWEPGTLVVAIPG